MKNKNHQKTFTLNFTSEESDEKFEGLFTVKRLSIRDRSDLGKKKSQLSGGMYCVRDDDGKPTGQGLDEDTDYLNSMIAHLEIVLIQKPDWFDLNDVADIGVVRAVYEEVWDFESSFFRTGRKDGSTESNGSDDVGGKDSSAEHPKAESGNLPKKVVDQEVPASMDA